MAPHRKTFHFSILGGAGAWRWQTLDSTGEIVDAGLAPSRKLAAACVIRALARSHRPERPASEPAATDLTARAVAA